MTAAPFRAEQLLGASLWRITFLLVQGGGSVILIAALGHLLDASAFATTALTLGVLVIAQAIGDFGLSQAAVTILPARLATAPEHAEALLAGAARACGYACGAALVLTAASALLVPHAAVVPILVSAPAAAAAVAVTGTDGLLRAQGEFRAPVRFVASSELAGFIGIPVALATRRADWTCAAISAGTLCGAGGAIWTLFGWARAPSAEARRSSRGLLRAAGPLGIAQVFVVLGARVDTLIAASLNGVVAAGTFEGDWRLYQLGQYAAGALATAAAPFLASALGAGAVTDALALLRRLVVRLAGVGLAAGVVLYLARWPLAHVLTGSLASPVAHGLVYLAAVSPLAAAALPVFYSLITLDGERRYVLGCFVAGAAVNLSLAGALSGALGVRGALIGSAAGSATTSLLLFARLAVVTTGLRLGAEPRR